MTVTSQSTDRRYVLTLAALTHTFAVGIPWMSMPVLFKEISQDLGLSLVQIGTVWGMAPLAGVSVALIGGLLGDRFGVKRTLAAACFLAGLAGALRGLSAGFASLAVTVFIFGFLNTIIPVNVHKTAGIWFAGRHLGFANGILSTGMGIGFTVGAMISATVLSPLLGGWRNVFFLYGAISILISILWLTTVREPSQSESTANSTGGVPFRQSLSRVIRVRSIWLLGLTLFGYMGCISGMIGYLPLYLRNSGWSAVGADGTLAAFNGVSTIGAIPLGLLSDRLGARKAILFPAIVMTLIGVGLLSVVDNGLVWVLVLISGIARDGSMALSMTALLETKGVGATYAGTALGLMITIDRLGSFLAPPLGNSLAGINPGLPFVFWAALAFAALFLFYFVKETGWRQRATV